MYKPLPNGITIKKSPINGLGLFATEVISENTLLGIIHIPIKGEKMVISEHLLVDLEIILMIPIVLKF